MKTKHIYLEWLTIERFFQFMVATRAQIESSALVKALLAAFLPTFDAQIARLRVALASQRGSIYTQQILAADKELDRLLVMVNKLIKVGLYHPDPAIVQAAKELEFVLKPYKQVRSKSYEAELARVKAILDILRGQYAPQAALLGITPWLGDMQTAEEKVEALFATRNTEMTEHAHEPVVALRKETGAHLHLMFNHVNAAATIDTEGQYNSFLAELNKKIGYENEQHRSHARKDLGAGNATSVVPVSTQAYTGKPIAFIPQVFYTEADKAAKELVFATDFTVTYKNNTKVGTAEVILHGKGGYKGTKVVTFSIV
jgi:hypothetical protein